jgi:hypothetical protein
VIKIEGFRVALAQQEGLIEVGDTRELHLCTRQGEDKEGI